MREIKFRAWNGEEMVSPDYISRDGLAFWKQNSIETYSDEVMQFTGLHDRKGKEIYEGDIIKCPDDYDAFGMMAGEIREVYECDGGFRLKPRHDHKGRGHWLEDDRVFEVIGNIHETPELLP